MAREVTVPFSGGLGHAGHSRVGVAAAAVQAVQVCVGLDAGRERANQHLTERTARPQVEGTLKRAEIFSRELVHESSAALGRAEERDFDEVPGGGRILREHPRRDG
jgi:hypothetical protein